MYAFLHVETGVVHFVDDPEFHNEPDWEALPDPPEWEVSYEWIDGEWVNNLEPYWTNLRNERTRRLRECDWTALTDVPTPTREAWTDYRQSLRDLPENTEDPLNPEWPTPPA